MVYRNAGPQGSGKSDWTQKFCTEKWRGWHVMVGEKSARILPLWGRHVAKMFNIRPECSPIFTRRCVVCPGIGHGRVLALSHADIGALQLHTLDIPHYDSHLRPFCSLCQQRILAQICGCFCSGSPGARSIRHIVIEARLPLRGHPLSCSMALLPLLVLGLLCTQRSEEALLLRTVRRWQRGRRCR